MQIFPPANSPLGVAQDTPQGRASFDWETQQLWTSRRDAVIRQKQSDQADVLTHGLEELTTTQNTLASVTTAVNDLHSAVLDLQSRLNDVEQFLTGLGKILSDKIAQVPGDVVKFRTGRPKS